MPPSTGTRERNRAETLQRLKAMGREHLAVHGAAALSLRAIARDLDMVSSGVYRYVASRDELLTLLIIDAYDALGEHVERSAMASRRRSPAARWVAAGTAIRDWALTNPHEYALVYGSPVPGYAAPADTIAPATRPTRALLGIVADAHATGRLDTPAEPLAIPPVLRTDLARIAATLELDVATDTLARATIAWTQLFGLVSFEVFGQTRHAFTDDALVFTTALAAMASFIGLCTR